MVACDSKYDEYFKLLIKQMNDPDCSLHFFHWQTKLPLEADGKEFHPGTEIPKTECKQKMMAMVLCNVDLWFLNLYQSLKEIFDGKTGHNIFDCNQEVIFDKSGDFSPPCSDLYSMYKIWYERNHPEDKLVSSRKFGSIMVSILGQELMVRQHLSQII